MVGYGLHFTAGCRFHSSVFHGFHFTVCSRFNSMVIYGFHSTAPVAGFIPLPFADFTPRPVAGFTLQSVALSFSSRPVTKRSQRDQTRLMSSILSHAGFTPRPITGFTPLSVAGLVVGNFKMLRSDPFAVCFFHKNQTNGVIKPEKMKSQTIRKKTVISTIITIVIGFQWCRAVQTIDINLFLCKRQI